MPSRSSSCRLLSNRVIGAFPLSPQATRFLERDELSKFTFQNEFLRPFVVVIRQSQSVNIREMIIRCVSQARYSLQRYLAVYV